MNDKWIYTYDYAPDSVWEPWRDSVYANGGLDEKGAPLWGRSEADEVADRLKLNLPAYILLADSHFTINGTWEDTVVSMKMVAERVRLSGIIHLGDMTDGLLPAGQTKEINKRVIEDMRSVLLTAADKEGGKLQTGTSELPLYIVPGNHDYNYFRGNPDIMYPDTPQYYVDDDKQKLRFIFIDSFDPKEQYRYGFSDYCVHWLDAVLNLMPDGYVAIVFSHVTPLVRLQAWTDNIRNREKLIAVLDRYADSILAFINGHNHCDHLFNDLHNRKFPIISINCAKCEYFTEHKPEGAVVPYRKLGDRTQESFDIMQVDTEKREIYFIRFGAGQDRLVRNGKAEWV